MVGCATHPSVDQQSETVVPTGAERDLLSHCTWRRGHHVKHPNRSANCDDLTRQPQHGQHAWTVNKLHDCAKTDQQIYALRSSRVQHVFENLIIHNIPRFILSTAIRYDLHHVSSLDIRHCKKKRLEALRRSTHDAGSTQTPLIRYVIL